MENIISGTTGFIHLIASIIALITGLSVLVMTKGTKRHKLLGYIYTISMILLNLTAFMIYKLFGKFGIFHWCAIASCLTLFAGLYPVLTKKSKNYLVKHFCFMYWSVIGVYSALMAEVFARLPKIILTDNEHPMTVFYKCVGIGTGAAMIIGLLFFIKYKPKWTKQYQQK